MPPVDPRTCVHAHRPRSTGKDLETQLRRYGKNSLKISVFRGKRLYVSNLQYDNKTPTVSSYSPRGGLKIASLQQRYLVLPVIAHGRRYIANIATYRKTRTRMQFVLVNLWYIWSVLGV